MILMDGVDIAQIEKFKKSEIDDLIQEIIWRIEYRGLFLAQTQSDLYPIPTDFIWAADLVEEAESVLEKLFNA